MNKVKSVWAVGIVALLMVIGGAAWAATDSASQDQAGVASNSSPHEGAVGGRSSKGSDIGPPTGTGVSQMLADRSSKQHSATAEAVGAGRVAATFDRTDGMQHCTLLSAFRVGAEEPVKVFEDSDGRTISGGLPAGRYVFRADDDCESMWESVWVGGGIDSSNAKIFTVRAGGTTRLNFVMAADPVLELSFTSSEDGEPVVGEPFDVYDESGELVWSWVTDESGRIQTTVYAEADGEKQLRKGTYRFVVAGNEFTKVEFTIDLRSDVTRTIKLEPLD